MANKTEHRISKQNIIRALLGALLIFLVAMGVYAYACYDIVYGGGCLCPMCYECTCDCATLSLYKKYFFNPVGWLFSLGLGLCGFVCLLPKFKYSKLVKGVPLAILILYIIILLMVLFSRLYYYGDFIFSIL